MSCRVVVGVGVVEMRLGASESDEALKSRCKLASVELSSVMDLDAV